MFKLKETFKAFPKTRSRLITIFLLIIVCLVSMGAVMDITVKDVVIYDTNVFTDTATSVSVKARQATVGQLLEENGISLGEYDNINLLPDEQLTDNAKIFIRRGVPFTLTTSAGAESLSTTKATVKEALMENGVYINDTDEVLPERDSLISAGINVTIAKIVVTEVNIEEEISYNKTTEKNSHMYKDETKVTQKGVNGKKNVLYRITQKDGVEESRQAISETVIQNPVDEIVQVGTKERTTYSKSTSGTLSSRGDLRYKASYTMRATAYDPSPASNGGSGRTALGMVPKYGIVAVDPTVIPLGSRLYIESSDDGKSWVYGYAIAGDTGGAIKGNKIDLCFGTKSEAYAFGVKKATVYVLE